MRRVHRTAFAVALLAALAAGMPATGCGKAGPPTNTAPFRQAIAEYLKPKSMDMAVSGFESLEVDGETATAVCKMEAADDLYGGVGVRWTFAFRNEGGAWRVESHRR